MACKKQLNIFFFVFFLNSFWSYSQETEISNTDSLMLDTLLIDSVIVDSVTREFDPDKYWGVLIDVGISSAPLSDGGVRNLGGFLEYKKLAVGFLFSEYTGSITDEIIFPTGSSVDYKYGQVVARYAIYQSHWLFGWIGLNYARGEAIWQNEIVGNIGERYNIYGLGAIIELNRLYFIRPYLSFGYQKMDELNLPNTENLDFSDIYYGFGLRIGLINK